MNAYHLTVATPAGNLFDGDATFLSLRGSEGDLAVMAGHTPFVTGVQAGEITIELADGTVRGGTADGGLLTVAPDTVTLLASSFKWDE